MTSSITRASKERYERSHPIGRDYISNLPGDILSHILSRLPIKDAIRTCVLSENWKFKWTFVYNVNINMSDLSFEWRTEPRFTNIVERVLVHVQGVEDFSLECSCPGRNELSHITTLIFDSLRREVKFLKIEILDNKDIFLPHGLLNRTSLRKLDLLFGTPCSYRVPKKNSFPHLKSLRLGAVQFLNEISGTNTLIFTFPVLKELELLECEWVNVKLIEFHAPSLCAYTCLTSCEYADEKNFDYSVKLIGATIRDFYIDGDYIENIIMNGSTVTLAHIGCHMSTVTPRECGLQVRKLLRGVPNLRRLNIYQDLSAFEQTKQELPLPRFSALEDLYIMPLVSVEGLLELLHAAPSLKSLEIDLADIQEDYDFDSLECLPSCVVHHLEKVTFNYIEFPRTNYSIEKFLLKSGAQLKSFFVWGEKESAEDDIVEKLSTFSKASSSLKIMKAPCSNVLF